MSVLGTVRNGRIEIEGHLKLPEGARARIEMAPEDWIKEWDSLVKQVSEASRGQPSGVQFLSETRR